MLLLIIIIVSFMCVYMCERASPLKFLQAVRQAFHRFFLIA
jgi:hypothetical protein